MATLLQTRPETKSAEMLSDKPRYEGWKVSREEYLDLDEDGFKYDMIEGVLHLAPSGEFEHGKLQLTFGFNLIAFLETNDMGKAVTEIDVFLPDGGDVVRPDVSFLLTENLHIVKTHIHGVPDLVCEVLSAGSIKRDLGIKAQRYLKNGVKEYWIIYPKERKLELLVNKNKKEWEKLSTNILKSTFLKGFKINQKEFFK